MALRARLPDDVGRVGPLVEPRPVEVGGEDLLALADGKCDFALGAHQEVDDAGDRRRVEPARERRADRHVAAQPKANRVEEQLAEVRDSVSVELPFFERPVLLEVDSALPEDQGVRGRQLPDTTEERLGGVVDEPVLEVVADAGLAGRKRLAGGAERLELAREHETTPFEPVVEGLDAEAVARAEELATLPVPDRERPHPVEPLDAASAPLVVGGEDHLGVRAGAEAVTAGLELTPELEVVVDLAVVDESIPILRIGHRLPPRRREIENREPPEPESHTGLVPHADVIGAAMGKAVGHLRDLAHVDRALEVDGSAQAAHRPKLTKSSRPSNLSSRTSLRCGF